MSEEAGENKPKRLRLSRDTANPTEAGSSSETGPESEKKDLPPQPKAEESGQNSVPKFKLSKPKEEVASTRPPIKTETAPPAEKAPPPDPIKESEIGSSVPQKKLDLKPPVNEESELPPPLPRKVAEPKPEPVVTKAPTSNLDQAFDKIEKGSKESNPLAGILVIVVLLLIFGGGGYGIWYVLKGMDSGQSELAEETEAGSTSSYGITLDRAKETIGAASTGAIDEVMEVIPGEESEAFGTELVVEEAPKTSPKEQKEITDFLENAVYGGVRSGSNARVMINGESYRAGDEIFEIVGLVFVGTKDGQLVFRDKNGIVYTKRF
ncbi:MAG: hypothetical protein AAF546_05225 [Verrucomicrobiota bacterium]